MIETLPAADVNRLSAAMVQESAELEHQDNLANLERRIEVRLSAISESKRSLHLERARSVHSARSFSSRPGTTLASRPASQAAPDSSRSTTRPAAQAAEPGQAEAALIGAKDAGVTLWNLAMEAVEALVSVPTLATAGMNSGTRALPLPGLQHEREAKERARGGPDFSVPLITQIQKMEREGYFGEPERNLIQDPLGVLALAPDTAADSDTRQHNKRLSLASSGSVASLFHQPEVIRNSMAEKSLYSSTGSTLSQDPSLMKRVPIDSLYSSAPGRLNPPSSPENAKDSSRGAGADDIRRKNVSINPYHSQRLYGSDKQAAAPTAGASSRAPKFPGAHPIDAQRVGLHHAKTSVIARIIPRKSPSPPRRHAQPPPSAAQTPRDGAQTPRSQARVSSRPQSISSLLESAEGCAQSASDQAKPMAPVSSPPALQFSNSPFRRTLAAEGRGAPGEAVVGKSEGATGTAAEAESLSELEDNTDRVLSLKERMKTAISRARAAVDAMEDEEQVLRRNLAASSRRALGDSPRGESV